MAFNTPPRQMSLIPYASDEREIVLRRGNAIVLYDATSQQLTVRDARSEEHALELTECPYCHRPFGGEDFPPEREGRPGSEQFRHHGNNGSSRSPHEQRPFVDPEYFGMLAASQRASPLSTTPGTPRLVQPAIRSGRSRDVSGAAGPPSGAEFVGSEATGQGISSSAFSQGYFKQFFREQGELGRGGNGVVLLVEHVMDGVSLGNFACKRIPVGNDHAWLEKTLIEVKLLKKIPHTNLVPYYWVWLEDHQPSKFGPSVPCLWILQEYCNGGDLQNYVLGPKPESPSMAQALKQRLRRHSRGDHTPAKEMRGPSKLTFEEIFTFFRDITSGLHHLHSKGYIHRDLKPSNCLLQRDGNKTRVLISDFGEVQAAGAKRKSTGATGTISYCAPEVLSASNGAFGDFSTKSDIFSLGMIVYFMCFGRLPYLSSDGVDEDADEDLDELRKEITAWTGFNPDSRLRADLPEKLYKYLRRLLSVDPNERPSTEEILTSIKAETGLGDMFSNLSPSEESPPRVSSLDSPAPRPSPAPSRRKPSVLISRPGLSSAGRHRSDEHRAHRSPSPVKPASRPSTADPSAVARPRKIDLPPSRDEVIPSPQQSPRLMLPPPPHRPVANAVARAVHHPLAAPSLRVLVFVVKVLTLSLPCAPFAANSVLLYPLIGLAGLDLGILEWDMRRSGLLLALHLAIVYTMRQWGVLCEGRRSLWEDL